MQLARPRRLLRAWFVAGLCLVVLLSACSFSDDEGDAPTAGALVTATAGQLIPLKTPTSVGGTTGSTAGELSAANSQTITDGVCQALVPDDWVDDGTGRGTSASGARYVLFGGRVGSDADWQAAADIVTTPSVRKQVDAVDRDETSVRVTYANGRGFEYRKRFNDKYCDFAVTSTTAIPDAEQSIWAAILDSLEPVS